MSPGRSRQPDPSGSAEEGAGPTGTEAGQPAAEAAAHADISAAPASQQAQVHDTELLQDTVPAGMEDGEPPAPHTEPLEDMQLDEVCQEPNGAPHDPECTMTAASNQARGQVHAGNAELTDDDMDVGSGPAAPTETAMPAAACGDEAPDADKTVPLAEPVSMQQGIAVVEEHAEQLRDNHGVGNQQSAATDKQSVGDPTLTSGHTPEPLQLCTASCGEAAHSPVVASQAAFGSPLSEEQPRSADLYLDPQPLTSESMPAVPGAAAAPARSGLSMLFMPLPAAKLAAPASTGKQLMAGSSRPAGGWFGGSADKVRASPAARRATSGPSSRLAPATNSTPGPSNLHGLGTACASPAIATPAQLGSDASLATAVSPTQACSAATPGGMQLPPRHAVAQHAAAQSRVARSTKAMSLLQNLTSAAGSLPERAPPATAAPQAAQQPDAPPGAKRGVQGNGPGEDAAQPTSRTPAPVPKPAAATAAAPPASGAGSGKDAEHTAHLDLGAAGAGSAAQCSPAASFLAPFDTSRAKDMVVNSKRLEDVRPSLSD